MTTANLETTPEKPVSLLGVRLSHWEIVVVAIGVIVGLVLKEFVVGLMAGLIGSSVISTYFDRKSPRWFRLCRVAGIVFSIALLVYLIVALRALSDVLPA